MGTGTSARELRKRAFGLDADGPADVGSPEPQIGFRT
ncbi:unnamed protein product, partial [marine sediment metagenome]